MQNISTRTHERFRKGGSPDQTDVYVQPELVGLSTGFMLDGQTFAHQQMFPSFGVEKEQGKYAVFPPADFMRDGMEVRADSAKSASGGFNVTYQTYNANVWAWHTKLGNQLRRNGGQLGLDKAASDLCANVALLNREVQWMSTYFKTGVWDTDVTAVASPSGAQILSWSDVTAKPIKQLKDIIRNGKKKGAGGKYRYNRLLFAADTWDAFCEHPNVLARINNGQTPNGPAEITEQMVANWLGIEKVIVADAIKTTSAAGAASATFDFIVPTGALLFVYAAPAPGILTPTAGYTFNWQDVDSGAGAFGQTMIRWYDIPTKSWFYEIEQAYTFAKVCTALGTFVSGLLST